MFKNITKSKIMIISKNHSYTYLIEEILKESDKNRLFDFIKASNIKSAIQKALWETPHLIIIDIEKNIEELDSLDFFYQSKLINKIPVLLLIDMEYESKKLEKLLMHKYDFIKKPINHKELRIRANYLINLYKEYLQKEMNQTFIINSIIEKREEEIERRKKFFKTLINGCSNMIGVIDEEINILEINRSWIKEFGSKDFSNRVLRNEKLFKKYIPIYEDKTFLNNYEKSEWIDILKSKKNRVNNLLVSKDDFSHIYKVEFFEVNLFKEKREEKFVISLSPFSSLKDLPK